MPGNKIRFIILLVLSLLILLPPAFERTISYYDNVAAVESGRALLKSDVHTYEFHTYRPVGQVLYAAVLAAVFGVAQSAQAFFVFSVLWIILGALGIARLATLWLGSSWGPPAYVLALLSPAALHLSSSGYVDLSHVAVTAWGLLALLDPKSPADPRLKYLLFWLAFILASMLRPTFLGLAFVLLFALDFGRCSWRSLFFRQALMALGIPVVLSCQLLMFIRLRGLEYGWHTFKNLNVGLFQSHVGVVDYFHFDSKSWLIITAGQGLGWILTITGLAGLLVALSRKLPWARVAAAFIVFLVVHSLIIPIAQARYFLIALVALVPAALWLCRQLPALPQKGLLILLTGSALFTLSVNSPTCISLTTATPWCKSFRKILKNGIRKRAVFTGAGNCSV